MAAGKTTMAEIPECHFCGSRAAGLVVVDDERWCALCIEEDRARLRLEREAADGLLACWAEWSHDIYGDGDTGDTRAVLVRSTTEHLSGNPQQSGRHVVRVSFEPAPGDLFAVRGTYRKRVVGMTVGRSYEDALAAGIGVAIERVASLFADAVVAVLLEGRDD